VLDHMPSCPWPQRTLASLHLWGKAECSHIRHEISMLEKVKKSPAV
jgi:hypothetical protein